MSESDLQLEGGAVPGDAATTGASQAGDQIDESTRPVGRWRSVVYLRVYSEAQEVLLLHTVRHVPQDASNDVLREVISNALQTTPGLMSLLASGCTLIVYRAHTAPVQWNEKETCSAPNL